MSCHTKFDAYLTELGEREREREIGAALLREPLRECKRHVAAVVEAATAGAQLLELHGLGARGQRRHEPEWRSCGNEQYGPLEGATTRILIVRMTPRVHHACAAHIASR